MFNLIAGKIAMETKGAVNSLRDVDDELDRVRASLVAGSDAANQFENSISDSAREQASMIKRTASIAALALKTAALNATAGVAGMLGMKQADKMLVTQKELLAIEDQIAEAINSQTISRDDEEALLLKQLDLENKKSVYYAQAATMDRVAMNNAKEMAGIITMQLDELYVKKREEEEISKAEIFAIQEQIAGRGKLGEMLKDEVFYKHQINQAIREGRGELAKSLQLQESLTNQQQLAAQQRQTTRQRIDARTAARKEKSDADKQIRRNAQLDRDILRGVNKDGAFKGNSRLEERRRFNRARNDLFINPQPAPKPPDQLLLEIKTVLSDIKNNTEGNLTIAK